MEIMLHNKFLTQILLRKQTGTCYTSTQRPYLVSRKKIIISRNNTFYSILYNLIAACYYEVQELTVGSWLGYFTFRGIKNVQTGNNFR
jgi:hypothetical protein